MKKQRLFKDHHDGLQLHAGRFRGNPVWHSDDGGKTWWSGFMFSNDAKVTQKELVDLAVSILRETPNATDQRRASPASGEAAAESALLSGAAPRCEADGIRRTERAQRPLSNRLTVGGTPYRAGTGSSSNGGER